METRSKKKYRRRPRTYLDLTPLIDVVFLLLIFFMLSSSFVLRTGVELNPPASENINPLKQKDVTILLTEQEEIFIVIDDESVRVARNEFIPVLMKSIEDKEDPSLLVLPDEDVPIGTIIWVFDQAQKAGIKSTPTIGTRQVGD